MDTHADKIPETTDVVCINRIKKWRPLKELLKSEKVNKRPTPLHLDHDNWIFGRSRIWVVQKLDVP
jgi:hypothetical protein